ncbi:RNA-binding protein [Halothermothrix orenii]|uniref:RNA-binding S4 domain protein n=1 Tax=Halothermothrix orenii (strain H 168 / OCM 544 / DSM 9562) TaxID=373903 RepID=B8CWL2_HALOH|nr:YlmH/Sll1252 family protein [Halothermothrix orenii]ACL69681.1 RNA-binding S4 domain protein [Halothermothrix orenii H 168]
MFNREKMLSHLHTAEEQNLGGQILDKIEIVVKRKSEVSTNFLNPHEQSIAEGLIKQVYDINYKIDGGYDRAERKRVTLFPDYLYPEHVKTPVCILKVEGNFKFNSVSHRDFLGAILGLGIKREMIGDILILKDFAEVVVAEEIKEYICLRLKKVHQVPVNVEELDRENVVIPAENTREFTTTVPSMRLDAVSSAGFGDSRNKISRIIKSEKVKVNWKKENNPAQTVEIGDLISIKGRGRVQIVKNEGLSHRGRVKLRLKRFL